MCRKSGLEKKRRCGWLRLPDDARAPLVWVRRDISLNTCPKFYATAESQALVEDFLVRRRLGGIKIEELSARQVEAFLILEKALAAEMNDAQHNTRHAV